MVTDSSNMNLTINAFSNNFSINMLSPLLFLKRFCQPSFFTPSPHTSCRRGCTPLAAAWR